MGTHITSHDLDLGAAETSRGDLLDQTLGELTAAGRLLSAGEVALMLGVPRSFVYALARRRAIPTVRLGDRYVRFRPDAIRGWIGEREQPSRSWS